MKKFFVALLAAATAFSCVAAGCNIFSSPEGDGNASQGGNTQGLGGSPGSQDAPQQTPDDGGASALPEKFTDKADIIADFSANRTSDFYSSDGYSNGGMFNCTWSRNNTVISGGVMNMTVSKDKNRFYGAEYRTRRRYSYGYYSVCMKAAKCSGVVSSFFTYTNNPWDEIDIEFLGNDTTKVQFNYYTSGTGGHEYHYSLGFDASEDFHEYGFDWQRDSITWYVDGKPVYRAEKQIPVTDTQIMMNVWNCTGHDDWTGPLDESSLPATAQYKWVAYKAA